VMFERETFVEDPDTYDVTGWSLPIAFGLDAWHTDQRVDLPTRQLEDWAPEPGELVGSGDVALVIDARQHHFPAAVGKAVTHELFCRLLGGDVVIGSHRFAAGSLVVHRVRNQRRDLDAFVEDALALGVDVHRVDTGLAGDAGPSLGNNANPIMRNPRVLLVTGSGTSSYSAGQHWHLLDVAQPFPHTRVTRDRLASIDLTDYTVIVMPSMGGLSGRAADRVRDWVRGGGTVVATSGAARWALTSLADASDDASDDDERTPASELTWAQRERRAVDDRVSGALAIARLDATHPMAAGVRPWLGMLVRGYTELPLDDNAYAVARYDSGAPIVSGPVSEENLDKMRGTPLVIHQRVGSGAVIAFAEDVTIRGFQHGAMRLLMNAIVYGPTLSRF